MIEIRNNRIYFYNEHRRDIIPVDFPCMSAYVCPHCKKILAAYYAGVITDLDPFSDEASPKHHYKWGESNGGQYMLLEEYYHREKCQRRQIISLNVRGVRESIEQLAIQENVKFAHLYELAELVEAGMVPGFEIVQDICGADGPVVLYNEREFINMNDPGFAASLERKNNLAAYVDWVAAGDYSKPFEPPAPSEKKESESSRNVRLETWICVDCRKPFEAEDQTGEDRILCPACKEKPEQSPFGEIIDAYTRSQALADGVLIDVTETAKEAGIIYPTAVTQALWDGYIVPPESLKGIQDIQGRLWDVLMMFRFSAKASKSSGEGPQTLYFKTLFQMPTKTGRPKMETATLKAVCGLGDTAEPVLTMMLEGES